MIAVLSISSYFAFTGSVMFLVPEVFTEMSDWWRRFGPDADRVRMPPRKRWGERVVGLFFLAFGAYGATFALWGMMQPTRAEIRPIPRSNAWEFLALGIVFFGVGLFCAIKAKQTQRMMLDWIPGLLLTTEGTVRLRTLWPRLGGVTFMLASLMPLGQWLRSLQ